MFPGKHVILENWGFQLQVTQSGKQARTAWGAYLVSIYLSSLLLVVKESLHNSAFL